MKYLNLRPFVLQAILSLSICLILVPTAHPQDSDKGKITEIRTDKNIVKRGETLQVRIEVQNLQRGQHRQLVVLNILDSAGKTVYDSHPIGKDIEFSIGYNEKKVVGPFAWTVPSNLQPGTYTVLIGYREQPWDPLISFKGASWCPPEKTITIR